MAKTKENTFGHRNLTAEIRSRFGQFPRSRTGSFVFRTFPKGQERGPFAGRRKRKCGLGCRKAVSTQQTPGKPQKVAFSQETFADNNVIKLSILELLPFGVDNDVPASCSSTSASENPP